MKKVALLFSLAIFLPSLILAWLAARSIHDQQIVLERQQAFLCQAGSDALAGNIRNYMLEQQRLFGEQVETILTDQVPRVVAVDFHGYLLQKWPFARVGFAVTMEGQILSPSQKGSAPERRFWSEYKSFLENRETAAVYPQQPQISIPPSPIKTDSPLPGNLEENQKMEPHPEDASTTQPPDDTTLKSPSKKETRVELNELTLQNGQFRTRIQQAPPPSRPPQRNVSPIKPLQSTLPLSSRSTPSETGFHDLIKDSNSGALARFMGHHLNLLFWYRSPLDPLVVFGSELEMNRISSELGRLVHLDLNLEEDICVALLDESGNPIARTHPEFQTDWKHPFVATEIGDILPHWEVALYLTKPERLNKTAQSLNFILALIIGILISAIAIGGWLLVQDLQRQLLLARQKTDFVSNVSHELKTPLTSIRIFSELLAEDRVKDPVKRHSYLQIISAEAARLTRLINNVLDFSRMERGEKKYEFRDFDIIELAAESIAHYRPHLDSQGISMDFHPLTGIEIVRGDRDAIAQILVNLVSNAEKYGPPRGEITISMERISGPPAVIQIHVEDRGPGIPSTSRDRIFEKFYRAHDSLNSGIQGSGLGLTLARQIARAHHGDVFYQDRPGGGSRFTLQLPAPGASQKPNHPQT